MLGDLIKMNIIQQHNAEVASACLISRNLERSREVCSGEASLKFQIRVAGSAQAQSLLPPEAVLPLKSAFRNLGSLSSLQKRNLLKRLPHHELRNLLPGIHDRYVVRG